MFQDGDSVKRQSKLQARLKLRKTSKMSILAEGKEDDETNEKRSDEDDGDESCDDEDDFQLASLEEYEAFCGKDDEEPEEEERRDKLQARLKERSLTRLSSTEVLEGGLYPEEENDDFFQLATAEENEAFRGSVKY